MKTFIFVICHIFCVFSAYATTGIFPQSAFDQLSYGLYWFGENNQYEQASVDTQHGSAFYNPTKPTLIMIHGWQPDHMKAQDRKTFLDPEDTVVPDIDFANLWRSQGYNIGYLYWDQFADERIVSNAEAKIWSATTLHKMRWRDSDGKYHQGSDKNVTELLLENYLTAMQGYQGQHIRLAGHSLGNQLAIRLTYELLTLSQRGKIHHRLVPSRVSLLDAFYSNFGKRYLDWQWVGEVCRDQALLMKEAGIAIDSYRSSLVISNPVIGDENASLMNQIAFEEQVTSHITDTDISGKHRVAVWRYLWSIQYPTPPVSDNQLPGLSAATSNSEVRQWMRTTDHLVQSAGQDTPDPQDDVYQTTGALSE